MPSPSNEQYALRSAELADIPALQGVEREADSRFVSAGHPELADHSTIPTNVAEAAIGDGRITVAEVLGEVVGWVYVGRIAGELSIGQLSVATKFGRRGIGSALLAGVIEVARSAQEPSIVLNTQADVPWSLPFYERQGFSIVSSEDWSEALAKIAEEQSSSGLDWSNRVHMRLVLV